MNQSVSADDLRTLIENYMANYPQRTGEKGIWRQPLLATAVADKRFDILPQIAAEDHSMPGELLPTAKSVIVFFVPFIKELAVENHKGEIPCRNWGLAYQATNLLIGRLCEHIADHLEKLGFKSASTPTTHNFDHTRLVSRWSHKHLAHLAGLGRLGVNAQLITPAGCAGRLGSLVTEADLGDAPLTEAKEHCLYKNGHKCLVCVKRCPVGAVSEAGIDRALCWQRLKSNLADTQQLKGLDDNTHVCAKCQVIVPCSLKIPRPKQPSSE